MREKIPDVIFAVSAATTVAGGVGVGVADHLVDHEAIHSLDTQAAGLNNDLNAESSILTELYADGKITIPQAKRLGASATWISLEEKLGNTNEKLVEEEKGNQTVGEIGFYGLLGGGFVWAVSGRVRSIRREQRQIRANNLASANHNFLMRNPERIDETRGLEKSAGLPAIAVQPKNLLYFSKRTLVDGIAAFVRDNDSKDYNLRKIAPLEGENIAQRVIQKREDAIDALDLLDPLFPTKFTAFSEYEKGNPVSTTKCIDASGFGQKLTLVTGRMAELYATQLAPSLYSKEDLARLDEYGQRYSVIEAARALDTMLPLDQEDPHNPRCRDFYLPEEHGRHWIDFINDKAKAIYLARKDRLVKT